MYDFPQPIPCATLILVPSHLTVQQAGFGLLEAGCVPRSGESAA